MTTVPEEAVKAALNTIDADDTYVGEVDHLGQFIIDGPVNIKSMLTAALPHLPQGVGVKKLDDAALSASVNSYASNYEFRGDNGDYTPTDGERVMIEDAIEGFLSNFLSALEPSAARELALEEGFRKGLEAACEVIDAHGEYDRQLCCDGRECGCYGATVHQSMQHYIRALSSPDHADAGKVEGDGWKQITDGLNAIGFEIGGGYILKLQGLHRSALPSAPSQEASE